MRSASVLDRSLPAVFALSLLASAAAAAQLGGSFTVQAAVDLCGHHRRAARRIRAR